MKKQTSKNIFWLFLTSAFAMPTFWLVNISHYAIEYKGIPESLFYLLFGGYSLLVVLLEVPTGVVSDKVSRKASLLLGYLAAAIGFIGFLLLPGLLSAIFLFLFVATSASLISGSFEAILYDTLVDSGTPEKYKSLNAMRGTIALSTAALYTFLGGIISNSLGPAYTFIFTSVFYVLAFISGSFVEEPNVSKKAREENNLNYLQHTYETFRSLLGEKAKSNGLLVMTVSYGMYISVLLGLKYVIPPIFSEYGYNDVIIGSISSLSLLAIGISAVIFISLWRKANNLKMFVFSVSMILGAIVISFYQNFFLLSGVILLMSLGLPFITTIIDQKMNDRISSSFRSSIISLRNMLARAFGAILLAIFGLAKDNSSTELALIFMAFWLAIPMIMLYRLKHKKIIQFK